MVSLMILWLFCRIWKGKDVQRRWHGTMWKKCDDDELMMKESVCGPPICLESLFPFFLYFFCIL